MVHDPVLYVILWVAAVYGIFMLVMIGRYGHERKKSFLILMTLTGTGMTCAAAFLLAKAVAW